MSYVSRSYLNEKWNSVKSDMESCLHVDDLSLGDEIDPEDIRRCYSNLTDDFKAILKELSNTRKDEVVDHD